MELNEEKLEIEEKECPMSTFIAPEGQPCELITEAGNREINNDILRNKEYLPETTINESQSQKDAQLDSNSQEAMHTHNKHVWCIVLTISH